MFVSVDGTACAIKTIIEYSAISSGYLATISGPHALLLIGDRLLSTFQPAGLARCKRTGIYSLLNALLLIAFALVDTAAR